METVAGFSPSVQNLESPGCFRATGDTLMPPPQKTCCEMAPVKIMASLEFKRVAPKNLP